MKTSLWMIIALVTGIVGFLMGYSVSSYSGTRSAAAIAGQAAPASHDAAPVAGAKPQAGGYGAAEQPQHKAAAGGYGGAEQPQHKAATGGYGGAEPAQQQKAPATADKPKPSAAGY